jgi:ElaB/YqjD/DUF883 family membrane-anchored ribosome-binding protein
MDDINNAIPGSIVRHGRPNGGIDTEPQGIRHTVGRTLESAAGRLRDKTADANVQGSGLARFGTDTADNLDRLASYVRDADAQKVKSAIEQTVRQNPGKSLIVAGIAGLLIGSILRRR